MKRAKPWTMKDFDGFDGSESQRGRATVELVAALRAEVRRLRAENKETLAANQRLVARLVEFERHVAALATRKTRGTRK